MKLIKWILSALLAYIMQLTLDMVLPDMQRLYVICIAGFVGIIWSSLDNKIRGLK